MQIPLRITIVESNFWLDGGTVTLHALSETGEKCRIQLNQRCFLDSSYADPGRLLFNDKRIDVRSETEARIVSLLKTAELKLNRPNLENKSGDPISKNALILGEDIKQFLNSTPEDNLSRFREQIVAFVESEEYVKLAQKLER